MFADGPDFRGITIAAIRMPRRANTRMTFTQIPAVFDFFDMV
nr:hypothetical protein [Sicyoidochytrium minutum DNA virus]